ncbi:hypothetical protein Tco_0717401 [Tanacetum coccineum]
MERARNYKSIGTLLAPPLPSAIGLLVLLKASTKRSWVRICLRANIPSATSAADVAVTWACGTQSADMAVPHGLT